MINQRITKLRQLMKERGIDLYIIPTSDFHQSEYVGSYFEARHYMSGFSGSAGTLLSLEALFKNIMIKTIGIIRVWYLFYCQLFAIFM